MFTKSIIKIILCAIAFSSTAGCIRPAYTYPMFVRIKSLDRNYDAKAQYAKHSPVPPDHTSIDPGTGVETWVWNMEVTRKRLIENPEPETIVGKTVWELYKAECRYTVAFDAQGNRMDSRFTGAGCFDKDGKLYKRDGESDFAYDFLSI